MEIRTLKPKQFVREGSRVNMRWKYSPKWKAILVFKIDIYDFVLESNGI